MRKVKKLGDFAYRILSGRIYEGKSTKKVVGVIGAIGTALPGGYPIFVPASILHFYSYKKLREHLQKRREKIRELEKI
ncbi:MAG: hypothetical protein ABIG37_02975 [Nanoarchaeota archaeon]|nr:hypothetical protein [Nanoarchaeota archaeon]